jgi:hypothetical protein
MSSSDGTGAARRAVAEQPQTATPSAAGDDEDGLADPWFSPGPKLAAAESDPAWSAGSSDQAEWFLPTGRAGLLPDSMTESWDDDNGSAQADRARAEAAGAPPWGRDGASAAAGEPPPWETGPWPGPGEAAVSRSPVIAADRRAAEPAGGDRERSGERRQRSRLIMAAGGAVLVLIVAIVVIVTVASGSPATGCATYPAPVRQAYARAMSDLGGHATASLRAADLERAASMANSAAAAAGQTTARTALFAMASDLDEAYSDVSKHRPITSDLQQRLAADGTALPRSCSG